MKAMDAVWHLFFADESLDSLNSSLALVSHEKRGVALEPKVPVLATKWNKK